MSGTAVLLSVRVLAGESEVRKAFQAAGTTSTRRSSDSARTSSGRCRRSTTENHFTYAELEENEVDLVKLRNWFAKVRDRDVFGADGRHAAEQAIDECEQSLEAYAARVYAEEAEGQ